MVVLVLIGGTTVAVGRAAMAPVLPADAERTVGGGSTMFRPNAGEGDLAVRPSSETPLLPWPERAPLPNLAGGGGGWSLA